MASTAHSALPTWFRDAAVEWGMSPGLLSDRRNLAQLDLRRPPYIRAVQSKRDIERAHGLGFRCLTYIALMDFWVPESGRGTRRDAHSRPLWNPARAGMLLLDKTGRPVNTFMDGSKRMNRFTACANTQEYWDGTLELVRSAMERGTDGLFIDNACPRQECYGHNVTVGYSRRHRAVVVAQPGVPVLDPELRRLPRHTHLYPDRDHNTVYQMLLHEVRRTVRSYGSDKVVVKNGEGFTDCVDGVMLESYICSWAWKHRVSWSEIRKKADDYRPYIDSGHRVVALSFLGHTTNPVKDDAFFCYAAARISGFIWGDGQTMGRNDANRLYGLDLGAQRSGILACGGVDYSAFQNGIVAINGTRRERSARIRLAPWLTGRSFEDVYSGTTVRPADRHLPVRIPANAGRVYLCS